MPSGASHTFQGKVITSAQVKFRESVFPARTPTPPPTVVHHDDMLWHDIDDDITTDTTPDNDDDDDDDDTKPQPDHYHPSLPHHVSLSLSRPASLTALTSDAAWRRCRRRRCRSRTPRSDRNLCVQCTIKRSPSKIAFSCDFCVLGFNVFRRCR